LNSLKNDCTYLSNGEITKIGWKDLHYRVEDVNLCIALALEGYPNRDSLAYKDLYGLKYCQKVFRGTLRYKGFSLIICAFKELGLFDTEKPNSNNWFEYM